mmetsp:Transcript_22499/g.80288  ORF Transcript_22499/g.80288 Transcript_22499/m.80288 type:complete len:289 (+) Transcript_22499:122-988(+)
MCGGASLPTPRRSGLRRDGREFALAAVLRAAEEGEARAVAESQESVGGDSAAAAAVPKVVAFRPVRRETRVRCGVEARVARVDPGDADVGALVCGLRYSLEAVRDDDRRFWSGVERCADGGGPAHVDHAVRFGKVDVPRPCSAEPFVCTALAPQRSLQPGERGLWQHLAPSGIEPQNLKGGRVWPPDVSRERLVERRRYGDDDPPEDDVERGHGGGEDGAREVFVIAAGVKGHHADGVLSKRVGAVAPRRVAVAFQARRKALELRLRACVRRRAGHPPVGGEVFDRKV